jgi:purine-binding chemotaxis protein CheW
MNTESLLCTFVVEGLDFGVEVHRVQEVIRHQAMTPVPLAPAEIAGLINLRGQIVTALDLRRRLGVPDRPSDQLPMNVVMRTDDEAVSLLVDAIGDVVDVSDIPFEAPPETLDGIARELIRGAYKLDDRLLLFLDAERALTTSASTA